MSYTGQLFIISAPSGAGKTSLVKQMLAITQNIVVSVSHTTRNKRPGERQGHDYFFVDTQQFKAMLDEHAFLEHAKVFDNYYGTARQTVLDNLAAGLDVVLEIDWQGAQQIKKLFPDSLSIYIVPPSIEILQQRLEGRGQDDADTIARRMRDAVNEMSHIEEFDYLVVNDDFEQALRDLTSIILANRLLITRQTQQLAGLLSGLMDRSEY